MSLATTLDRIAQLQALADPQAAARAAAARRFVATGTTTVGSALGPSVGLAPAPGTPFADALRTATATPGSTPMIDAARTQAGVVEAPPGSNDSPEIARYRQAVAGAPGPGPWCAYFVSWAAR